jgi:hypothetical protein
MLVHALCSMKSTSKALRIEVLHASPPPRISPGLYYFSCLHQTNTSIAPSDSETLFKFQMRNSPNLPNGSKLGLRFTTNRATHFNNTPAQFVLLSHFIMTDIETNSEIPPTVNFDDAYCQISTISDRLLRRLPTEVCVNHVGNDATAQLINRTAISVETGRFMARDPSNNSEYANNSVFSTSIVIATFFTNSLFFTREELCISFLGRARARDPFCNGKDGNALIDAYFDPFLRPQTINLEPITNTAETTTMFRKTSVEGNRTYETTVVSGRLFAALHDDT